MGGGDKTNQSITSIPVLLFLEREREREGREKEKSISPRGNPSWRGINERERKYSLRLMTRSRQREETSDRLSLGKLSARLERVASHPRSFAHFSSPSFSTDPFEFSTRRIFEKFRCWNPCIHGLEMDHDEFKHRRRLRNYLVLYN